MTRIGFVYHPDYLLHDTGDTHPESKKRLIAIIEHLEKTGLMNELTPVNPREATIEMLCAVHDEDYVHSVRKRIENGESILDAGDTAVGKGSWRAALLAAGGACSAADAVMKGEVNRVFCTVRPPGHHAGRRSAMGFCIFNNIAIAARHLQKEYGIERVMIIDWDVHHGNSTQEMFYGDASVFYLSIHQYPYYPGTGSADEIGEGKGRGFTCNIPVLPGTGDEEYLLLFDDALQRETEKFKPEFILISAGFDSHQSDPLANLMLDEKSYIKMTATICQYANEYTSGRIVSVLEGGYSLDALARSVEAHIRQMMK